MSDESDAGSGNSDEMVTMYECRKCKETFTEEDREAHRLVHRKEKESSKQPKKGRRGQRAPTPTRSEATLFNPIPVPRGEAGTKERRKRVSKKNFDRGVKKRRYQSG